MFDSELDPIKNQFLTRFDDRNIEVYIKREDEIHPDVSGNKFRKLKYNVLEAKRLNHDTLLTFGGAYSNHILAVAAVGYLEGFKTIGIIRGDELGTKALNPTLAAAQNYGMTFKFCSRTTYREKHSLAFKQTLADAYGSFYMIAEGGTNPLAVKGCEEILTAEDAHFDVIACAVGTGGTVSGIINSSFKPQIVLGFPVLKASNLKHNICSFVNQENWRLIDAYHFGGYAKINLQLIEFINGFKARYKIALDPLYTGKLMFGIFDLIAKGYFKNDTKILVIHTGGIQGIEGMNKVLKQKQLPIIE